MATVKKPLSKGSKPKEAKEPAKMGRPTDYRPEYGRHILDNMSQGFSLTAAAADLGVHRGTVYDWMKKYPEFENLVKVGQDLRIKFLENRLISTTQAAQITAMIFALKCARSEEWRDVSRQEVTGKDGGPMETIVGIQRTIVDPKNKG